MLAFSRWILAPLCILGYLLAQLQAKLTVSVQHKSTYAWGPLLGETLLCLVFGLYFLIFGGIGKRQLEMMIPFAMTTTAIDSNEKKMLEDKQQPSSVTYLPNTSKSMDMQPAWKDEAGRRAIACLIVVPIAYVVHSWFIPLAVPHDLASSSMRFVLSLLPALLYSSTHRFLKYPTKWNRVVAVTLFTAGALLWSITALLSLDPAVQAWSVLLAIGWIPFFLLDFVSLDTAINKEHWTVGTVILSRGLVLLVMASALVALPMFIGLPTSDPKVFDFLQFLELCLQDVGFLVRLLGLGTCTVLYQWCLSTAVAKTGALDTWLGMHLMTAQLDMLPALQFWLYNGGVFPWAPAGAFLCSSWLWVLFFLR